MGQKPKERDAFVEAKVQFNIWVREAVQLVAEKTGLIDFNVRRLQTFVNQVEGVNSKPDPDIVDPDPNEVCFTISADCALPIALAFREYLHSGGRKSLDELLGARGQGPGRPNYFQSLGQLERNARLMLHLHMLRQSGLSINNAAAEAAKREPGGPYIYGIPHGFEGTKVGGGGPKNLRKMYERTELGYCWKDICVKVTGVEI